MKIRYIVLIYVLGLMTPTFYNWGQTTYTMGSQMVKAVWRNTHGFYFDYDGAVLTYQKIKKAERFILVLKKYREMKEIAKEDYPGLFTQSGQQPRPSPNLRFD